MPPGQETKSIGQNKYCIDESLGARYTNSVMIMTIKHIACITCLVTNDAWNAYDVIGVYKIHHGADRISYFAEPAILWLGGTVLGVVGARNILRS